MHAAPGPTGPVGPVGLFELHREALAALCRDHGVHRLDLFGSAASAAFDPDRCDIDLLVAFGPQAAPDLFAHYRPLLRARGRVAAAVRPRR